jgi:hypothetical protein
LWNLEIIGKRTAGLQWEKAVAMEACSFRIADHPNKETAFRKEAAPDDTPVVPGDGTEHNNLIAEAVGKSDPNSECCGQTGARYS